MGMFMDVTTQHQTAELIALRAETHLQKKQIEELRQAYENLQQQMQDLLRHRFGTRSERHPGPTNPQIDFLADAPFGAPKGQEDDAEK